jgi:hypothetical protein
MKSKRLLFVVLFHFFYTHPAAPAIVENTLKFEKVAEDSFKFIIAAYSLQENLRDLHDGTFWLLSPLATQNSTARNLIAGGFCAGLITTCSLCVLKKKSTTNTLLAGTTAGIAGAAVLALQYPETRSRALLSLAYPALFYLKHQVDKQIALQEALQKSESLSKQGKEEDEKKLEKILVSTLFGCMIGRMQGENPLGELLQKYLLNKKF